ncbi:UNKNOWN [Stylonychia lemnae]|uniref:PAP-associated domain-containing protein n=1 Tax=Stylonychia lemnae TaxID=5949 RepID=A0A078B620_STYLE|nr:UNKNOWN [Stylonychia lemnae]|eukprot:CDW88948.1 UNKNOWN [Stylonychia lemnae]
MLMILKCFLKSRQLNEPYHGGVGSFLLTMLVTSYLQRRYKEGGTDKIDLGRHLIDFLELYGTKFNYEDIGISIRDDGFYYQKSKRGWQGYDERTRSKLSVENPQDSEVDIGGSAFNIKRVQRAFQHAYDTLIFNNSNSVSILKLIITSDPSELKPNWRKFIEY